MFLLTSAEADEQNIQLGKAMKNPNLQIKFERRFLLADLPAPLTRASEHLQFFDNYLTDTRLLLRRIRTPQTREWTRKFVQKYPIAPPDLFQIGISEIELSEYEYEVLSVFEGNELRYNRYFYELENDLTLQVDMFLNRELWNLITATIESDDNEKIKNHMPPPFVMQEITHDDCFSPLNLANATIEDVRRRLGD